MAENITEAMPSRREIETTMHEVGEATHVPPLQQAWEAMEATPKQFYYFAAAGSMIASIMLFLFKKRESGIFVGLWPPTFLILGLLNKLAKPSKGT